MPEFECDVFVSYKREERASAERVAQKLKDVGLKVWFDTKIKAGQNFDEQIAGHLKASRIGLVCWTPDAIASTWVRAEATMAHTAGKLLAVFLEPTELIPPFNLVQTEDLSDWNGEDDHGGWTRLLIRIAALSGNAALIEWAAMMNEGSPSQLRAWASAQTPGPLRATTRYWISEIGGAGVGLKNTAQGKRRARVPWVALSGWAMAGVAMVLAGVLFAGGRQAEEDLKGLGGRLQAAEAKLQTYEKEKTALSAQIKKMQEEMLPYAGIDRRRKEGNELRDKIEVILARQPWTKLRTGLAPPTWKEDAEAAIDRYLADLKMEYVRLSRPATLSPAPLSPSIQSIH